MLYMYITVYCNLTATYLFINKSIIKTCSHSFDAISDYENDTNKTNDATWRPRSKQDGINKKCSHCFDDISDKNDTNKTDSTTWRPLSKLEGDYELTEEMFSGRVVSPTWRVSTSCPCTRVYWDDLIVKSLASNQETYSACRSILRMICDTDNGYLWRSSLW